MGPLHRRHINRVNRMIAQPCANRLGLRMAFGPQRRIALPGHHRKILAAHSRLCLTMPDQNQIRRAFGRCKSVLPHFVTHKSPADLSAA